MRDLDATLRSPAFFDRDVLLAAGVIADDGDWRAWTTHGWLPFIIKATDAQAVALFGLVQVDLKPEQRATEPYGLLCQADALLHDRADEHGEWAHALVHQAAAHLSAEPEILAQAAAETPKMLAALATGTAP